MTLRERFQIALLRQYKGDEIADAYREVVWKASIHRRLARNAALKTLWRLYWMQVIFYLVAILFAAAMFLSLRGHS